MGEAEFRRLTEFSEYEINRKGVVRRVGGKVVGARVKQGSGVLWVQLTRNYQPYGRTVSVLLVEAFGPGAAQAAGMQEPDMARVKRSRGRTHQGRARKVRTCTTCGKPTSNYRCEACWRGVRGFSFGEASNHATPFD